MYIYSASSCKLHEFQAAPDGIFRAGEPSPRRKTHTYSQLSCAKRPPGDVFNPFAAVPRPVRRKHPLPTPCSGICLPFISAIPDFRLHSGKCGTHDGSVLRHGVSVLRVVKLCLERGGNVAGLRCS